MGMNTLTLGLRNAFRNTVRTVSLMIILGISIGLCLVMLIAHQAVAQKIRDIKASVGNTITVMPAGFSDFSQANNALTTAQLDGVKTLPHVASVTESLTDRLSTIGATDSFPFGRGGSSTATTSLKSPVTLDDSGKTGRLFIRGGGQLPADFSLPVSILGTTDPAHMDSAALTLSSGAALDGAKDSNTALVSTAMAGKNNLKVGSTFTAYNTKLTVAGIFTSASRAGDGTVIVPLPALQRLTGQSGAVDNAVVTADSLDNLANVTSAIKQKLGSNADVTSAQDAADSTVGSLENVATISLLSLIGALIAGSVIILLTMVMIVRERRREIGILKAIGGSNARVVLQFMCEAVTLTVAGAVVGVLIGVAGGNPVTNMLVQGAASSSTSAAAGMGRPAGIGAGIGRFGGGQSFAARPTTGGFLQRNGNSLANSAHNISANIGWNVLIYGLGAAVVIALIGSALAGWMIARIKPYEVMRAE